MKAILLCRESAVNMLGAVLVTAPSMPSDWNTQNHVLGLFQLPWHWMFMPSGGHGNGNGKLIYVSIYIEVSDTAVARPEADKAGQSPRGRWEHDGFKPHCRRDVKTWFLTQDKRSLMDQGFYKISHHPTHPRLWLTSSRTIHQTWIP